ncbi:DUF6603 domain-containing protein [Neobacillus rhizophilus]|uniref:DUF6603 domain-containing protein n=1 Tax=Neobacillus rhizophilus TaxID=2833579 RepID=A0A942YWL8_9BACI|nr:DUF6603 domain-containing protein [Neobacillus rhizophilus]MBS4215204.1 hypothetical protein [Neobacillus rhizophilus]
MANPTFLLSLMEELNLVLDPLRQSLESAEKFSQLLEKHGWQTASGAFLIEDVRYLFAVTQDFEEVQLLMDQVLTGDANSLVDMAERLFHLLPGIVSKMRTLTDLNVQDLAFPFNQSKFWEEFPGELIDDLFVTYLHGYRPILYGPLSLLGIVEKELVNVGMTTGRINYTKSVIRWDRLQLALTRPAELIEAVYGWGTPVFDAERLLQGLKMFLEVLGYSADLYFPNPALLDEYFDSSNAYRSAVKELRLPILGGADFSKQLFEFGFSFLPITPEGNRGAAPVGLAVGPAISGTLPTFDFGELSLSLVGGFSSDQGIRLEVRPGKVKARASAAGTLGDAEAALKVNPENPIVLLGTEESHRVELSDYTLRLLVKGSAADADFAFEIDVNNVELIIDLSDADGFLSQILGNDPQRFKFGGSLTWSSKSGLTFGGRAGLIRTLPVNQTIGLVEIQDLLYGIDASENSIDLILAVSGKFTLGPFAASIAEVGAKLSMVPLDDDEPPGTFGNLDLRFDFKPPTGIGLKIDASVVAGGGYLYFDHATEQYAGILQLEIKGGISIKAIGLLTTRLPEGSKGFSLLVIIAAEFPPIQLGFGFTLNGLGGLFGANRTMSLDVLRAGIKNRALDSIMFPRNPVENAPKIINDLKSSFPPAQGRFVFGPMAKLSWGTPPVLTAELGILLELPNPVRLVLLGRMKLVLPHEEAAVAKLQMDVVGAIDFDKGDVSIDATLFDSRLAAFVITGDMAMRLNFGASPSFALAAGGFNPRFQPPPGFPKLNRMTISLADSDNPRLRLEAYMAVTSNTYQVGARLDLYAEEDTFAGRFSVQAYLGFDALIQFDPFGFTVDIGGAAALKRNGDSLFAVQLEMTLSGPKPIHAHGKAMFDFLGKREIAFEVKIGDPQPSPALPPVDALASLQTALADQRNWSTRLPGDGRMLVTTRELLPGPEVLVHPLGELSVSQKVVPLGLEITKFGNAKPAGGRQTFAITSMSFGDSVVNQLTAVKDAFAPAMFIEMSDTEKLSRPAFEQLQSGVRAQLQDLSFGTAMTADFEYETAVIDKTDKVARSLGRHTLDPGTFTILTELGSAANSPMNHTGEGRFAGPARKIMMKERGYSVVNADDMKALNGSLFGTASKITYTEAEAARVKYNTTSSSQSTRVQVVGSHEVVKS